MRSFFSFASAAILLAGVLFTGCKSEEKPDITTSQDSGTTATPNTTGTTQPMDQQVTTPQGTTTVPAIGSKYLFTLKTYDIEGKSINVNDTVIALQHLPTFSGKSNVVLFEERNRLAYSRFYLSYGANGDISYRAATANASWLTFPIMKNTEESERSDTSTRLAKIRTTTSFTPVGAASVTLNNQNLPAIQVRRNRTDSSFTQFDTTIATRQYDISYIPSIGMWSEWNVTFTFSKPGMKPEVKATSQELLQYEMK